MANPFARALALNDRPARLARKRFYAAGAQFNRLTADFIRAASSPDTEVRADLRQLRNRARQLVRDNPFARRFVRVMVRNIVGPMGIVPVPCNVGADNQPAKKANAALFRGWREWSYSEHASIDGRLSWPMMQSLMLSHLVTDGEFILRKWPGIGPFGFALEPIDPELLDEQYNQAPDAQGVEIKMGIKMDRFRRPISYFFHRRYPSEPSALLGGHLEVPAEQIIHRFVPLRVGQSRGISWFAPVLLPTRHLDGFQEAVLVNARTSAAKMGFFVTQQGAEAAMAYDPPDTDGGPAEKLTMQASPGLAEQLPPGWTFQEWDPKQPTTAFDQFTKAILLSIAMGLDVSYISLTGDLRQTSYSSARVGLLDERDGYRTVQRWFADEAHRPIYREWVRYALLTPMLALPSADPARWQEVRWHPRGWDWIDPLKDITALKEEIALGVNSRQRAVRDRGDGEFAEILAELATENELAIAAGVDISGATVTLKETGSVDEDEVGNGDGADEQGGDDAPPAKPAGEKSTTSSKAGRGRSRLFRLIGNL